MCLYPRIIRNKKYTANKKNGGIIPPVLDNRVLYVPIGCGSCMECVKQKARAWQVRLLEEVRHERHGKFVTLTFSNESIVELANDIGGYEGYEQDNQIATKAMRRFLERWRKKYKKSLRHWFVTELGHNGTENIHLHGIVWAEKEEMLKELETIWKYGIIWTGDLQKNYVNEKTVNYLIKYVYKVDKEHTQYTPKILTSPGIGRGYVERSDAKRNKYNGEKTNELYKTRTGHKIAMPIYWRNKIYSDEEREKLWLQRLDKEERWVCGERVDIRNNETAYYELLKWHRMKAKKLGYNDGEKNWEKKQYENERRRMNMKKRGYE